LSTEYLTEYREAASERDRKLGKNWPLVTDLTLTTEGLEMTTKKPKAVAGKIHLKWVVSAICAPVKQKDGWSKGWALPA